MPDDLVWIVPVALGVLGLVVVFVWRRSRRRRFRRRLRGPLRQLDSFDADERARAGTAVVELGLTRRTANVLVHYVAREEDEQVRLRIALTVVRRNGEPSHRRRVRRLQTWAIDELVEHGHPTHQVLERKRAKNGRKRRPIRWRATVSQS